MVGIKYLNESYPHICRDVFWQGTCDDGCYALADLLGWGVSRP